LEPFCFDLGKTTGLRTGDVTVYRGSDYRCGAGGEDAIRAESQVVTRGVGGQVRQRTLADLPCMVLGCSNRVAQRQLLLCDFFIKGGGDVCIDRK
jgi:hypothetical protein